MRTNTWLLLIPAIVLAIAVPALSAHPFVATQISRVMVSRYWLGVSTHLSISGSPALILRSQADRNGDKKIDETEKKHTENLLREAVAGLINLNLGATGPGPEPREKSFHIEWGHDSCGDYPLHIVYFTRLSLPAEPVLNLGITAIPLNVQLLPNIVPAAIVEVVGDEAIESISSELGVKMGARKVTALTFPAGIKQPEVPILLKKKPGLGVSGQAGEKTLDDFITWSGVRENIDGLQKQMARYDAQDGLSAEPPAQPAGAIENPMDIPGYDSLFGTPTGEADAGKEILSGPEDSAQPDRLVALLHSGGTGIGFLLGALAVACVLGAFHALSPGHGKSLVAAYLVGTKGRARDAVILGITVTIAHVGGVLTLGAIALALSDYLLPQKMVPYIETGAGILVTLVGITLIFVRSLALVRETGHHHHSHEEEHEHEHSHHHHEDNSHGHSHHHHHHHGKSSLTGLLLLGISGGIVPCPTAFVVLLVALSINRLALGLAMLLAFSLGLGLVLIVIALLITKASPLVTRLSGKGALVKLLPLYSALLVTLLGGAMLVKAFISLGIIVFNG